MIGFQSRVLLINVSIHYKQNYEVTNDCGFEGLLSMFHVRTLSWINPCLQGLVLHWALMQSPTSSAQSATRKYWMYFLYAGIKAFTFHFMPTTKP